MKYRKDTWEENDVTGIYLHSSGFLFFYSRFLTENRPLIFNIKQNRWYNILIEQKSVIGKVIIFWIDNIFQILLFTNARLSLLLPLMGNSFTMLWWIILLWWPSMMWECLLEIQITRQLMPAIKTFSGKICQFRIFCLMSTPPR